MEDDIKKEKKKRYMKEWINRNPEKYKKNNDFRTSAQKERLRQDRRDAVKYLGGKCIACSCSEFILLQIDHINGGGGRERKEKNGTNRIHKEILAGLRNDLRILCVKCNIRAKYFGSTIEGWPEETLKRVASDKEFHEQVNK